MTSIRVNESIRQMRQVFSAVGLINILILLSWLPSVTGDPSGVDGLYLYVIAVGVTMSLCAWLAVYGLGKRNFTGYILARISSWLMLVLSFYPFCGATFFIKQGGMGTTFALIIVGLLLVLFLSYALYGLSFLGKLSSPEIQQAFGKIDDIRPAQPIEVRDEHVVSSHVRERPKDNDALIFIGKDSVLFIQQDMTCFWDLHKRAPRLDIKGEFLGISYSGLLVLTRLGQDIHAYHLLTGQKLTNREINAAEFAPHQRVVVSVEQGKALIEDVLESRAPEWIPLVRHNNILWQSKLVRAYTTPYIVVKTITEAYHFEAAGVSCYDLETGKRIFGRPSGYHEFQIAWSMQQNTLAIEESGHMIVYDLGWSAIRYDVDLPARQGIVGISLHPQYSHQIAMAMDNQIQLIDVSQDLGRSNVVRRIEGWSPIKKVAFAPDGERIASVDANYRLNVWQATSGDLIDCLLS